MFLLSRKEETPLRFKKQDHVKLLDFSEFHSNVGWDYIMAGASGITHARLRRKLTFMMTVQNDL
jgi:hypothetical protein